ncbi:MAG: hypothetical protein IKY66_04045, partial [Bacteroidales bacterium]|nr:hypothetical protein [Bacteroidales bacterium]
MSVYFAEDRCECVSMVHWEIHAVTYLRDTSRLSRKEIYSSYPFHLSDFFYTFETLFQKEFIMIGPSTEIIIERWRKGRF